MISCHRKTLHYNPLSCRCYADRGNLRVEVQSIGDIEYIDSADFTFRQDTFEILQAWYSSSLANDFSNGNNESWTDQSVLVKT